MYSVKIDEKEFNIDFDKDLNAGKINDQDFSLDTYKVNDSKFHILQNNKSYNVEIVEVDYNEKIAKIKVNNNVYEAKIKDDIDLLLKSLGMSNLNTQKVNELKAPMPGLVFKILVEEGQEVKKGDTLLILEAMKMENNLKSPVDTVIKNIACNLGTAVEKNEVLIEFE